jgi:hypothetical protein
VCKREHRLIVGMEGSEEQGIKCEKMNFAGYTMTVTRLK